MSVLGINSANAQCESIVHEGEIGLSAGASHYFGDLNTRARLNRPKLAVGAFFRKQFGNYTGLRVSAHFTQLGILMFIIRDNEFQRRRNLSFNSNLFELAVQGISIFSNSFQAILIIISHLILPWELGISAMILMLFWMAKKYFFVLWEPKDRVTVHIPTANLTIPWVFVFLLG